MKVLIAEDDPHMLAAIADILDREGYQPIRATNGREALARFEDERPEFVCLDIMMPELSGYDVCREIRRRDRRVPVVFLSAKSEEIDKVLGLELGADDYIMKPFGVKEFVARIRAISRRCLAQAPDVRQSDTFRIADLEVKPAELRAQRDKGEVVELSLREVKLLREFAANPGVVLDRDHLFRTCWGGTHYPASRTLDQHISQLRKKIEHDPKAPAIIMTVRGAGYRHEGDRGDADNGE